MKRKSISEPIAFEGIGLHSGEKCKVELHPAEQGKGIKFLREDLVNGIPINADVSYVHSTPRCTIIGKDENTVSTVEHLLASIYALGITDLEIRNTGPEIPILDGSAQEFYNGLHPLIEILDQEVDVFSISEPLYFHEEESGAEYYLYPSDNLSINALTLLNSENWADQVAELNDLSGFGQEIAPSRTYVFVGELTELRNNNLIKGGSLESALVLEEKRYSDSEIKKVKEALNIDTEVDPKHLIMNPEGMRFPNEPARHKILDILGDLSLLGVQINARIIAKKPGHQGNIGLVKFLKKEYLSFKKLKNKPKYDPDKEPVYDLEGVKELLPHRYPFLLVDKIIELKENVVVGIKNVTVNESFFQGHFPDNPIFPGVLQMEALAQTGGILALSNVEDPQNWDTYFLKMDNVKFKNKVVPGDTVILKMELLSPIRRGIVHMQGTAYVGNKIVSEGELIAQIIRRK